MPVADPDVDMGSPRKAAGYNPDQDPEEKRQIRRDYRVLQNDGEENRNVNDLTAQQLIHKVQRADDLFRKVQAPQEATLDSNFLLSTSGIAAAKARAMKSGSGAFDVDDFISKLITFMGGRRGTETLSDDSDPEDGDIDVPLDWEKIGRKALAKSRRIPAMDFMLGPLSVEQKKRNVGKRAKLEKNKADETRPQEIKEEDLVRSENETTKNVLTIRKLLQDQDGAVNFFRFIINPDDFAQSVENLFYLSFLIRDGICALDIEETGEPVIYLCEQAGDADYEAGLRKQQMVMELDMVTWKMAIDAFNITTPLIPQRPKSKESRNTGKWYA
ncbi:hypothetical protein DENSPDRAFT_839229 [Dentipellis sp. KUC8613]|nr:hypothetical protein DENSPDRAFT_839229 [Dentipellis sp. KUC8613]